MVTLDKIISDLGIKLKILRERIEPILSKEGECNSNPEVTAKAQLAPSHITSKIKKNRKMLEEYILMIDNILASCDL